MIDKCDHIKFQIDKINEDDVYIHTLNAEIFEILTSFQINNYLKLHFAQEGPYTVCTTATLLLHICAILCLRFSLINKDITKILAIIITVH